MTINTPTFKTLLREVVSSGRFGTCKAHDAAIELLVAHLDQGSHMERSDAWGAVCDALDKATPGWLETADKGVDAAVKTIEMLGTIRKGYDEAKKQGAVESGFVRFEYVGDVWKLTDRNGTLIAEGRGDDYESSRIVRLT